MQGNIIGQSGMFVNDSLFPIYQQLNQPIEYNGIWIKTEDNLKDVYFQTDDVRDYEFINDLPYDFDCGRATSVGSDIYLFGGEDDYSHNAYKYNTIEKMYTKLADVPESNILDSGLTDGAVVSTDAEIYITVTSKNDIYKYDIFTDIYTKICDAMWNNCTNCSMVLIGNYLYIFGSSESEYNQKACKYSIIDGTATLLEDIPDAFTNGSTVAINENEIALFSVSGENTSYGLYKYNITEDSYYKDRIIIGKTPSNTKINNFAYMLEDDFVPTSYNRPILTKYGLKNNSFYQYGESCEDIAGISSNFLQIANANNDLYLVSDVKLYKAKIVADYKGNGIYVISQETSLSKDLDINNVLDVKKIVNEEEQDIIVYVGDGESWKLLNGSDTTQNTNALQYALNFKGEN